MKIDELIETNKNNELKEILQLVKGEAIFFGENKRLLSKGEIENYKENLIITMDIIPLIDIEGNIFIIYDNNDGKFKKYDIKRKYICGLILSIENYIKEIYENMFNIQQLEQMVNSDIVNPN